LKACGSLRSVKRPVPKAQVDAYGPAIPQLAARAMRYARVLRIGRGHRGALVTRTETSPLEQGIEILFSVEPDRLGQRERERKREREREKKRERERQRERERLCLSLSRFFFCGPPTEGRARVRRASGRREPRVRGACRCKNAMTRPGLEPGISGSGGRRLIH
jgi:hypothetical protein